MSSSCARRFACSDAHSIQKGADIYMNKKRVPPPHVPCTLEAAATARRGGSLRRRVYRPTSMVLSNAAGLTLGQPIHAAAAERGDPPSATARLLLLQGGRARLLLLRREQVLLLRGVGPGVFLSRIRAKWLSYIHAFGLLVCCLVCLPPTGSPPRNPGKAHKSGANRRDCYVLK